MVDAATSGAKRGRTDVQPVPRKYTTSPAHSSTTFRAQLTILALGPRASTTTGAHVSAGSARFEQAQISIGGRHLYCRPVFACGTELVESGERALDWCGRIICDRHGNGEEVVLGRENCVVVRACFDEMSRHSPIPGIVGRRVKLAEHLVPVRWGPCSGEHLINCKQAKMAHLT